MILVWWHTPIILALWGLGREAHPRIQCQLSLQSEFQAIWGYMARHCLKKATQNKTKILIIYELHLVNHKHQINWIMESIFISGHPNGLMEENILIAWLPVGSSTFIRMFLESWVIINSLKKKGSLTVRCLGRVSSPRAMLYRLRSLGRERHD